VLGLADHTGEVDLSGALHGLYWLTMNLAERRPVLVAVDDVHWADRQSLGYLNYLAHRLGDAPILLVVAVRSGDPGAVAEEVRTLRGQASITLRPGALIERATSTLVRRLLGDRATPQVCADVHAVAGGNPSLPTSCAVSSSSSTVSVSCCRWSAPFYRRPSG
jgi:predicted ATPase